MQSTQQKEKVTPIIATAAAAVATSKKIHTQKITKAYETNHFESDTISKRKFRTPPPPPFWWYFNCFETCFFPHFHSVVHSSIKSIIGYLEVFCCCCCCRCQKYYCVRCVLTLENCFSILQIHWHNIYIYTCVSAYLIVWEDDAIGSRLPWKFCSSCAFLFKWSLRFTHKNTYEHFITVRFPLNWTHEQLTE